MKLIHIGGRQGRALCGIRMPFQIPINAPRMCLRCLNAVGKLRFKNKSRMALTNFPVPAMKKIVSILQQAETQRKA